MGEELIAALFYLLLKSTAIFMTYFRSLEGAEDSGVLTLHTYSKMPLKLVYDSLQFAPMCILEVSRG
jgi:hypothetical protein